MLAVSVFGQVTAPNAAPAGESNGSQDFRIGPGDVIDVVVNQNTALTRTGIRVNNNGRIQLPMIEEEVYAACKTERELSEQIKERYKKYLIDPHVIVAIREFNSSPVAVIGAVSSPGRFQLRRPTRVLELFTFVNGVSDKAGSNVNVIRNRSLPYCEGSDLVVSEGVGDELISINLSDTLRGVEEANPYVRAGDILMVSEAALARAYVMGSVKNPSIISLSEPVTLTQAIAMSGGFASGAKSDKVVIRRQIEGSTNRSEMIVSVKEVNQRKTDDVLLRPNDIVEVAGPGKFSAFLKTLVPTLTQLPLRVVP